MKNNKHDIRLALLCQHNRLVDALVRCGYYSKVKHLIDRYVNNGEYLIDVELFSNLIILRHTSPNDGFKTVLLDKVEF